MPLSRAEALPRRGAAATPGAHAKVHADMGRPPPLPSLFPGIAYARPCTAPPVCPSQPRPYPRWPLLLPACPPAACSASVTRFSACSVACSPLLLCRLYTCPAPFVVPPPALHVIYSSVQQPCGLMRDAGHLQGRPGERKARPKGCVPLPTTLKRRPPPAGRPAGLPLDPAAPQCRAAPPWPACCAAPGPAPA